MNESGGRWRAAAWLAGTALLVAACGGAGAPAGSPSPTAPPATPATPAATSTAPATASATSEPSPSPSATTTPTAPPTATLPPMPTAPAGPTPPPGYAESCAASEPWGVQVSTPFVCIDAPGPNTTVPPGGDLVVRGYAGGSFESHVLIEVGGVLAQSGSNMVAAVPLTYVAPDLGMPGFWSTTIHLPTGNLPSTLRVTASFSSPRDGSVVASASVDFSTR